jgi:hypothetical protein
LLIYAVDSRQSVRIPVYEPVEEVEICPNCPFLSFMSKSGGRKRSFVYDIEKKRLYQNGTYLDVSEHRWSPSGEYAYFNNNTSLVIVRNADVSTYLNDPNDTLKYVEIAGHPLGSLSQVAWIGDDLLYRTGVGEMECWGYVNLAEKKNKLVSCCGIAGTKACRKQDRMDETIVSLFVSKASKDELADISFNLYADAVRIYDPPAPAQKKELIAIP